MQYAKGLIFACCVVIFAVHETGATAQSLRRSIGGKKLETNKYPWVVELMSRYVLAHNLDAKVKLPVGTTTEETFCTGFFVDKYGTVVTASHCVQTMTTFGEDDDDLRVYNLSLVGVAFGTHSTSGSCYMAEVTDLSSIKHHPEATEFIRDPNAKQKVTDLAVIFLKLNGGKGMNCSDPAVGTIQLSSNTGVPPNGIFAGFGKEAKSEKGVFIDVECAEQMNEIDFVFDSRFEVTLRDHRRIENKLQETRYFTVIGTGKHVIQLTIKAGPRRNDTILLEGLCVGDSGGPYMTKEVSNGKETLRARGVASKITTSGGWVDYDLPCNEKGKGNIIADLNFKSTRDWLSQVLRQRYEGLGVLSKGASWDGNPLGCPE